MKNQYKGGIVCRFKEGGGAWQERGGGAFEGGLIPSAHYDNLESVS